MMELVSLRRLVLDCKYQLERSEKTDPTVSLHKKELLMVQELDLNSWVMVLLLKMSFDYYSWIPVDIDGVAFI